MERVTLEELEDLAYKAKAELFRDAEKNVTVAVESSSFSGAQIIIKDDGLIWIPEDSDLGSCTEIRVGVVIEDAPSGELVSSVAAVIAIAVDVFGMELDGAHVSLPDELDEDEIIEKTAWLLECGLEAEE